MILRNKDSLPFSLWSFITVDKEAEGASGGGSDGTKPAEGAGNPPGGEAKVEPPPAAPKPDGRDNRIKALIARQHAMQAELDAARAALPKPAPSGKTVPVEELPGIVEARASELAEQRKFDEDCAAVAVAGFEQFGEAEFAEKVTNLVGMKKAGNPKSEKDYNDFLAAIIETDEPARVIHELGSDMNKALEIYSLPAAKRAVAIAKLGMTKPIPGAPSPDDAALAAANALVSKAPPPIKPLGGKGAALTEIKASDERSAALPMNEWVKRREAEISAMPSSRFQRRGAAMAK